MIAEIWIAAAEVAMEFVATPFVSVHSSAAIAIAATGHSVTYVFSFLA